MGEFSDYLTYRISTKLAESIIELNLDANKFCETVYNFAKSEDLNENEIYNEFLSGLRNALGGLANDAANGAGQQLGRVGSYIRQKAGGAYNASKNWVGNQAQTFQDRMAQGDQMAKLNSAVVQTTKLHDYLTKIGYTNNQIDLIFNDLINNLKMNSQAVAGDMKAQIAPNLSGRYRMPKNAVVNP